MSAVDERTDAKAGWSTICRRGEHKTCAMARARCACSCHGPGGQTPPRPQEPTVSEATVTPLPTDPFRCDDCGRGFGRPQALGRHRTAMHGAAAKTKPDPKPKARSEPPRKPAVEAAPERQVLAVFAQAYHDLNGADVATCIESADFLIDAITNAGWKVVEA